jgi:hypothetical protein
MGLFLVVKPRGELRPETTDGKWSYTFCDVLSVPIGWLRMTACRLFIFRKGVSK